MKTDYHYNNNKRKDLRQKLRNDSPIPEKLLWGKLRRSQLIGLKFRRQYGIGPYVVDFYCPQLRLAIEVDGDSHYGVGVKAYDKKRQQTIEKEDIHFLRFTNHEVCENSDGVLETIYQWCSEKLGKVDK